MFDCPRCSFDWRQYDSNFNNVMKESNQKRFVHSLYDMNHRWGFSLLESFDDYCAIIIESTLRRYGATKLGIKAHNIIVSTFLITVRTIRIHWSCGWDIYFITQLIFLAQSNEEKKPRQICISKTIAIIFTTWFFSFCSPFLRFHVTIKATWQNKKKGK